MHHIPKTTVACFVMLMASAPVIAAPGPHLSWDRCWGDGQVANKTFACNTNSGSETLVVSYESSVESSNRTGAGMFIDIAASDPTLPAWWSLFAAGTCRQTALAPVMVGAPASACIDPYNGLSQGGIAAYNIGFFGPNSARLVAAAAVPAVNAFSVGPGTEQLAMRFTLNHSKTVGSGACAGCNAPVCIGVNTLQLLSNISGDQIDLIGGSGAGGSASTVTWQSAFVFDHLVQTPYVTFDCGAHAPVPTRRSTWNAVKTLYR